MAWTETHAIKLGWPFLSVLSYHCTGINESWGKTGNTKEPEREREEEKVREKWLAWSVAISQKRKINTSRNVACHVWTKEKEEEKS